MLLRSVGRCFCDNPLLPCCIWTGGPCMLLMQASIGKHYMPNNSCAPSRSPSGFYSDKIDCKPCRPGTYANRPGMAACDRCVPGTYQPAAGSTDCINCPAGSYAVNAGSTACALCEGGTWAAETGSTSCLICPAGQCSEEGAAAKSACKSW